MVSYTDYKEQFLSESGLVRTDSEEGILVAFELQNLTEAIYKLIDKLGGKNEDKM